jgi:hypothetical protein
MYVLAFFLWFFLSLKEHPSNTNIYKVCTPLFRMVKVHTTLSLDNELLQRAKEKGYNLSEILVQALKSKLVMNISDLPAQNLSIKCSLCKNNITEGFFCALRKFVLCAACQDKYNMSLCAPSQPLHEHVHFSFPENKNISNLPK